MKRIQQARAAPDAQAVRFILGRAAAFVELNGVRRPAWNYAQIARNLRRARKVKIDPRTLRRLVQRADPELFRLRLEANRTKKRRHPRTGAEVPADARGAWLLEAYDRIRRGGHEPTVLAKFGYHQKRG